MGLKELCVFRVVEEDDDDFVIGLYVLIGLGGFFCINFIYIFIVIGIILCCLGIYFLWVFWLCLYLYGVFSYFLL